MRLALWLRFTALLYLASWWLFLRRELLICRARVPWVARWCILARVVSYVTATRTPLHVADVMRGELLALAPRLGPEFSRPFGWLFGNASKLTLAARGGCVMDLNLAEVAAFLGVPLDGLDAAAREVFGRSRYVDDIPLMDLCVDILCDVSYDLDQKDLRWYPFDDGLIFDAEFFELRVRPRPAPCFVGAFSWVAEVFVSTPGGLVLFMSCLAPDKASAQAEAVLVAKDLLVTSFPSFFEP